MADINFLPTSLNISAISGDDVRLIVTVTAGTNCSDTVVNISNTTFASTLKTTNATYNATISSNVTTGNVTVTFSDAQTLAAGPGSWRWWMTFTDSDITRTRILGDFKVINRA